MIDLTPLDVRKKKGDFTRGIRGYDPQEVDHFLDMVAERLEEVVKANLTLRERVDRLADQVHGQEGRERAVQEALVTAQSLKHDIQEQARREAELIRREAESVAQGVRDEIDRILKDRKRELVEVNRARSRFLKGFRSLLERELDNLDVEEANHPADEFDLDALPIPDSVELASEERVALHVSLGSGVESSKDDSSSKDDTDSKSKSIPAVARNRPRDHSFELVPDGDEDEGTDAEREGDRSDPDRWGRTT